MAGTPMKPPTAMIVSYAGPSGRQALLEFLAFEFLAPGPEFRLMPRLDRDVHLAQVEITVDRVPRDACLQQVQRFHR